MEEDYTNEAGTTPPGRLARGPLPWAGKEKSGYREQSGMQAPNTNNFLLLERMKRKNPRTAWLSGLLKPVSSETSPFGKAHVTVPCKLGSLVSLKMMLSSFGERKRKREEL